MANPPPHIDGSYEQLYAKRASLRGCPTEFVAHNVMANDPGLNIHKPGGGDRALDIAFGDGRNAVFLCDQGSAVSGSFRIQADPYGYRLQAFSSKDQIETYLSPWFEHFSFGFADNDYYGVSERLFWVVCQKREAP